MVPKRFQKTFTSITMEIEKMLSNIHFMDKKKELLSNYHEFNEESYYEPFPGFRLKVNHRIRGYAPENSFIKE